MTGMARADLIALTDDGLVQLSNAGLVKRALRELDAGTVPVLVEAEDGTVEARFEDGTLTRLPPGATLADASCTCPATGLCRHRVMLAVAYRARGRAAEGDDSGSEARSWNPATLDLAVVEAAFGKGDRDLLKRLLASRQTVRIEQGVVPAAHLPMASVRFLVPHDLGYARCDCSRQTGCVHVALAIRAFRSADGATEAEIGSAIGADGADGGTAPLRAACDAVVAGLLRDGVVAGPAAHAQGIALARVEAERLGASQIRLVLDALTEQVEAYDARSARHEESEVLHLAVELHARTRAAEHAGTLGRGEPFETEMSKTRLVSLGARLHREGADIRASVLLADSDTGSTVLLDRRFPPLPGDPASIATNVAQRSISPGITLGTLARGQMLTSVARRRADGLLVLGQGSRGRTQVVPRSAEAAFPPPLSATHVEHVTKAFAARPFSFLRPRSRVADVFVFPVESVLGQGWSSGTQSWQGAVALPAGGGTLYLERRFDAAAPAAIDHLSAGLSGDFGELRAVAGTVRLDGGALVCDPWSLSADRLVVPDIDASPDAGQAAASETSSPLPGLLDEMEAFLASLLHAGARAASGADAVGRPLKLRLLQQGFHELGTRLATCLDTTANDQARAFAFCSAALWLRALGEIDAGGA